MNGPWAKNHDFLIDNGWRVVLDPFGYQHPDGAILWGNTIERLSREVDSILERGLAL